MQSRRKFFMQTVSALTALSPAHGSAAESSNEPVIAKDFESRVVYRSKYRPGYTSWVSFFPGVNGRWYLTCEEVTTPNPPLTRMSPERFGEFGLPSGMDKSGNRMEIVLLESSDGLNSWNVVSREAVRFQHSAGSFGQARVKDGRFLRFVWECYSLENDFHPGRILTVSSDNGRTWQKQAPLHGREFASYPHRLRTLRDGTLVLALPLCPSWGKGRTLPVRTAVDLNSRVSLQMTLSFSFDQGLNWTQPLPIFAGDVVSETDFVELPDGNLLCVNNSIFGYPGRQILYRSGNKFFPGPFERSASGRVPETVALGLDGLLVGCLRCSQYMWSDDLGLNWRPLAGIPDRIRNSRENYQPWIHHLEDGRFATAGHYGGDDVVGAVDQYLTIHFFRVDVRRRVEKTKLELSRDFDSATARWMNVYHLRLTFDEKPLANKEVEFWYAERDKPGYDPKLRYSLEQRMSMGGRTIRVRTDDNGAAVVRLPELDRIVDIHHSIQLVARFNSDRSDPQYQEAQTPMFENYSYARY